MIRRYSSERSELERLRKEIARLTAAHKDLEFAVSLLVKAAELQQGGVSAGAVAFIVRLQSGMAGSKRLEVFMDVARGASLKEAAFNNKIDEKTAQYHWAQIKKQLGIRTYLEAANLAHSVGLVERCSKTKSK